MDALLNLYAEVTIVAEITSAQYTQPTPSFRRNRRLGGDPTKSLAKQLATLLSVEGVEAEIEKSLDKAKARILGVWKNIFDGKICQELPTADGSRLFLRSSH